MSGLTRAFLWLGVSVALGGCGLLARVQPPTPFPSPMATVLQPTVYPTEAEGPATVEPTSPVVQLPTPPTLPPGSPIAHLPAGQEVTLTQVYMFDGARGWALGSLSGGDQHLLVTSDGAQTWKDVTPPVTRPPAGGRMSAAAFFQDVNAGWVVFFESERTELVGEVRPLVVWRTENGGADWQASQPVGVEFIGSEEAPAYLHFGDADAGWLLARLGPAGMHRYPVYLVSTQDGGDSWKGLVDPYVGPYLQSCFKSGMAFAGSEVGIVTIGSCPQEGPIIEITRDGGAEWVTTTLPGPAENADLFAGAFCETHSLQFSSQTVVSLAAECLKIEGTQEVRIRRLFRSGNAANDWESQEYPGGKVFVLNQRTAWALSRDIYLTMDGGGTWDLINTVSWDGQFTFVSDQIGWAVATSEDEVALVRTRDGGESWQIMEPLIAQ